MLYSLTCVWTVLYWLRIHDPFRSCVSKYFLTNSYVDRECRNGISRLVDRTCVRSIRRACKCIRARTCIERWVGSRVISVFVCLWIRGCSSNSRYVSRMFRMIRMCACFRQSRSSWTSFQRQPRKIGRSVALSQVTGISVNMYYTCRTK